MSEWGARQLGLGVLIEHPADNAELMRVFCEEDYMDLRGRLRAATPDKPIANACYRLHVGGQERWFKAVARPL